jgi:hypothetical protein
MEWKALANAVIHDGYDSYRQVILLACENCQNPFMHILLSNGFPLFISAKSRLTIYILECPDCGHRELDLMGVYGLPDYLPGTILPFTGHFFTLWMGLLNMAQRLERGECIEGEKEPSGDNE